ncbi:aromatic-ring-hydroxylating dioxygenase subunit beta [Marinobacter pelagius]|uniref:aromatic-ring-hydroxylating dioxygenase subunit beta n=1 Tax=Marinobacter sp. C7 TaxID=2951363 RepID=UPI001EF05DF3|nr:aromatic-ring-hydroxylating dioxygenase subunit beta [Marinobacter sp. C7]MCG7201510.1 aromatic-ring-hydroxylating dioxygenase subunit beta [Marinobacter sp. C7]
MSKEFNRNEIEDLLFLEADLLDDWKLKEWLDLYTKDASYYVPSTDLPKDAKADDSLFYIADDRLRMEERVTRLMKKTAHSEYPRSKTRHLVSNVRIRSIDTDNDEAEVSAAVVTFRTKGGNTDPYIGSNYYRICRENGVLKIREKLCRLDLDGLRPHGRVSIIL